MKMIKKAMLGVLASLALCATSVTAQTAVAAPKTETVRLEQLPEFKGGQDAMNKFLAENLKYPAAARESAIQGKVIVRVQLDEKGKIIQSEIGNGLGAGCDEEALRVVRLMKFNPGALRGVPTKMWLSVPVGFKLL